MDRKGARLPGQQWPRLVTLEPPPSAPPAAAPASPARPGVPPCLPVPARRARTALREAAVILGYLAAGVAVTWPRATYLAGRLPALRDSGGYIWDFWWMARQVTHLRDPWHTSYLAAPFGSWLGYHTLMPLPGLLLTPLTLISGPGASYNLLSIVCPGLLSYAMYRAARLWLPQAGSLAAGAFFGLSTILTWRSWYQVNLAAGALFFPLALAAAVRLRRSPRIRRALVLGAVLAAALLTDQESAVMASLLAALALLPWLGLPRPIRPWLRRLALAATAAATAALLASPQLLVMARHPAGAGQASAVAAADYVGSGAGLAQLFAPSPRLASYGLAWLTLPYFRGGPVNLVMVGYGSVLTALALAGLAAAWRQRSARLLALLWAGCSVLALGTAPWAGGHRWLLWPQVWHGVKVSALMPFTWFVQLPGLANFREADRFTELGLTAAALLAGAGICWLASRSRALLAVAVALGLLEAGWSGNTAQPVRIGVMPAALPALDRPIASDRSHSVVVDVPFGIRGGLPVLGGAFPPITMALATADGHPRGEAFVSRIPARLRAQISAIPFYRGLLLAQGGPLASTPVSIRKAAASARRLHIGWVIDWAEGNAVVTTYLRETGFRLAYRADGAAVYRPVRGWTWARGWLADQHEQAHYLAPVTHQPRHRHRHPAGRRQRARRQRSGAARSGTA
jgi:hypothetical protein